MFRHIFKNYIYPIAVMSGSIIGVGFLSLPYIAMKVGAPVMLLYFFGLTVLIIYLHLMFTDISLKTPDFKRFPGFVRFYLGSIPEKIILVLTVLGSFGVLLVYLVVAGQFLNAIFSPRFGGDAQSYSLLFFVIASAVIYFGIKAISKIEFWALVLLAVLFIIIFIKGFPHITLGNLFIPGFQFKISNVFLPYGAILFSLWGTGLIPEIEEMIRPDKRHLKKIIVIATLIPAIIYLLFMVLVLGVTGLQTTEYALTGLGDFLGSSIMVMALAMGTLTIFIAFVSQGLLLKKTFMYDMGVKELFAWGFACVVPLLLFLWGLNSFIPLISFIGGVFLGINGIFILLIYKKIKGNSMIIWPLGALFVLGIAYEVVYFLT